VFYAALGLSFRRYDRGQEKAASVATNPITLRVLDGADRGQVFECLVPPITIGREEGNSVQLNDERISRFHLKIQEDQSKLVLTDLESTNGTRVNGEDTHLRILRFGDVIALGRSVLLFGTRDQIAARLEELRNDGLDDTGRLAADEIVQRADSNSLSFELKLGASEDLQSTLHIPMPPDLPEQLSPGQAAQISELLEYLHLRTRLLIQSASVDEDQAVVTLTLAQWQELLDIQSHLAEYLRLIGDPDLR
jgi:pSer/pThr/pTyr-binding forkhead associated (FHA) protein